MTLNGTEEAQEVPVEKGKTGGDFPQPVNFMGSTNW